MLCVDDKDSCAVVVGFGRTAGLVQKIENLLYSLLAFHANEQCHIASPKKSPGAGKTGDAKSLRNQLIKHIHIIGVAYNGDDHLHFGTPLQLLKSFYRKHENGRTPNLGFNHHRLSFKNGGFHVGGYVLPPSLATFADVFHQAG